MSDERCSTLKFSGPPRYRIAWSAPARQLRLSTRSPGGVAGRHVSGKCRLVDAVANMLCGQVDPHGSARNIGEESRHATWQNDRIYVFGLNVSTPEPHVMRFHRLSLDGGFFRLPASPRSITLTRHSHELEIFRESPGSLLSWWEERQMLSISDIAGIQFCSQRRLRHRKRCVYFEINLVGETFDDHRISLLNLNGVSSGSSVMSVDPPENGGEEVRQLAESIGEFLDKPVWDHRREV